MCVADTYFSLLRHVLPCVQVWLVPVKADVSDFDYMLQLPGLFFDFGCEEQGSDRDVVAVEAVERVEHVETLHVDDASVDAKLRPENQIRRNLNKSILSRL